jgi:hypothetical protein
MMNLLLHILYWALGVFLTAFAGSTTYFSKTGAVQMERPGHALLLAGVWVFAAYKYMQYLHGAPIK